MSIIGVVIMFSILCMVLGRRVKKITLGWYITIGLVTIAQVAFVIHKMFEMEMPKP